MILQRGPSGYALLSGYLTGTLVLGSPVSPLLATPYYVDPVLGLDTRSPSEALSPSTPWQSLTHASSSVQPGDTIQLAPGTYSDSRLGEGGHESFPIDLPSGLSILGEDALLTTLRAPSNFPLFVLQEPGTVESWLAGLTLDHVARTGQPQNADIVVAVPAGTVTLKVDAVHFGEGSDAGLRVLNDGSPGETTTLNLTVSGSTFSGSAGITGEFTSLSSSLNLNVVLQDSIFLPTDSGFSLEQLAGPGGYSLNLTAQHCSFIGGKHGVASHRLGSDALGTDSWWIEESLFDAQQQAALSLLASGITQASSDSGSAELSILANQFVDGQDRGIFLSQGQLEGGTLNVQALISGNTFSRWAADAIVLSASSLAMDDIGFDTTIADNQIFLATSSGAGVILSQSALRGGTASVTQAIRGNTIQGAADSGLMFLVHDLEDLSWTYDTQVSDNLLQDLGGAGIFLAPTQLRPIDATLAFTVSNNTIEFSQESGFWFRAASLSGSGTVGTKVVAEENSFRQVGLGGAAAMASVLYTLTDSVAVEQLTTFSGNTISRAGGEGILVSHAMTASAQQTLTDQTLILSNQLEDTALNGIKLRHSFIVGSGPVALESAVVGNEVSRTGLDGISVSAQGLKHATQLLYGLNIYNNSLSSTQNGILASVIGVTEVSNLNLELGLEGNRVEEAVPQGAAGIAVDVRDLTQSTADLQLRVSGNVVKNKGAEGVNLSLSSQDVFLANEVVISDNILTGNPVGLALSSQDYRAPHILVRGNTLLKSTTYGAVLAFPTSGSMTPADTLYVDLGGGPLGSPGLNSFLKTTSGDALRVDYSSPSARLSAQGNTWDSTDQTVIQAGISSTGATVDTAGARSAQPSVRASATLTALLLTDEGAEGVTQGDTVRLIAQLKNTGEVGCAATFFTLTLPDGASFAEPALVSKGAVLKQTDSTLEAGLRYSAAGETSSVQADVRLSGGGCEALAFQGTFSCEQLGAILTDDPGTQDSDADAAVISFTPRTVFVDRDGDGQGDPATATATCASALAEQQTEDGRDCDDANNRIFVGGIEVCDGLDNDCDGQVDVSADGSNPGVPWYVDQDKDYYGSSSQIVVACTRPDGYAALPTDCNDDSDQISPESPEVCNAVDDDCDGLTDEDFPANLFFRDEDGDGFGDAAQPMVTCQAELTGFVTDSADCDDKNASSFPGAEELCDLEDNDCNGVQDDVTSPVLFWDADGDGYGDPSVSVLACPGSLEGFVELTGDCDDLDPAVSPGAEEVCNLKDDDCDDQLDEGFELSLYYPDADGDGYGVTALGLEACAEPAGMVLAADDCDDQNHLVYPGAAERCDGADTDCDGVAEGLEACLLDDTPLPETLSIVGNGCSCSTEASPSSETAGLAQLGLLLALRCWIRRRAARLHARP